MQVKSNYDRDIIQWSKQQAQLLRYGKFSDLDIEHIAEEIEDVGKSEQRELSNRMAVLIAHLLKWKLQPTQHCSSWEKTIKVQRRDIERALKKTPSLKADLEDPEWFESTWDKALVIFTNETNLDCPEEPIWSLAQIRDNEFYPS
ncbi:DUF29 domain-containing protein [Candidatus Thiosymbion oneisti]|uniref:DUF29 domain-containing protein n=1 Tax=Candidatus Thiosymbion oneisti TaxID=589554 RepID=UPI000B7DCCBB|nr:DUF29 domain-containing protein [Candidatus Thiosymbion oneisti]